MRHRARRVFLAARRGGGDKGVIAGHQRSNQRGEIFRQRVAIGGIIGEQHLRHAGDFRGGVGDTLGALPGDEDMDVPAQRDRRSDRGEGRVLEDDVVVFGEDEAAHCTAPMVFSFSTSSSTLLTLIPAWRLPGSTTLRTVSRGVTSTP